MGWIEEAKKLPLFMESLPENFNELKDITALHGIIENESEKKQTKNFKGDESINQKLQEMEILIKIEPINYKKATEIGEFLLTKKLSDEQKIGLYTRLTIAYYNLNRYINAIKCAYDAINENKASKTTYIILMRSMLENGWFSQVKCCVEEYLTNYPDDLRAIEIKNYIKEHLK